MNTVLAPPPTGAEIDRRLRIVAELRNLCLSLGRAATVARRAGRGKGPGNPDEREDR